MIWRFLKIRISYNFSDYQIWELLNIDDEESLNISLNYFGLNLEILKTIIKNKFTNIIHFNTTKEYINFLSSNKISFELGREVSYIIYQYKNGEIKITKRNIVDESEPLEIFSYNEGGYASLLPL